MCAASGCVPNNAFIRVGAAFAGWSQKGVQGTQGWTMVRHWPLRVLQLCYSWNGTPKLIFHTCQSCGRNFDLSHASDEHVNAEYLRGLINVVPVRGAGDRAGRYCIGRFAIDMYMKLLHKRQQLHPRYCHVCVFLPSQDQVFCGMVHTCETVWPLAFIDEVPCIFDRAVSTVLLL